MRLGYEDSSYDLRDFDQGVSRCTEPGTKPTHLPDSKGNQETMTSTTEPRYDPSRDRNPFVYEPLYVGLSRSDYLRLSDAWTVLHEASVHITVEGSEPMVGRVAGCCDDAGCLCVALDDDSRLMALHVEVGP